MPEHRSLFAEIRTTAYEPASSRVMFFEPSPMTHDPLFAARFQGRWEWPSAAVVYDFIPHDFPENYLAQIGDRVRYSAQLLRLSHYDTLFPISGYTHRRLNALGAAEGAQVAVTGVALRDAMHPRCHEQSRPEGALRRILVPVGDDWRKNPDVAVRAHAASLVLQLARVELIITGIHASAVRDVLMEMARRLGGDPSLLKFVPHITDGAFRDLYRTCGLAVVPSVVEGFSLPVVEACANGTPVLVSDCDAHLELIADPRDSFAATDDHALRLLLEDCLTRPDSLVERRDRQAGMWRRFTNKKVCERFWTVVERLCASRVRPLVGGHRGRPRLAVLTPMPPIPSGCADYSAAMLRTLARSADVSLFTETERPRVPEGVAFAGPPQRYPHLSSGYDAVVSVIGNSHLHRHEFDLVLDHGAAVIAHDARMLDFYVHILGRARAIEVACVEARRPVGSNEIDFWLQNPRHLPVVFLSEIAAASRPMMVHSAVTVDIVRQLYNRECVKLPFVPSRSFVDEELSPAAREAAKSRLGINPNEIIVATFGEVHLDRAPGELIWAVEQLRGWGYPARLVFIGNAASEPVLDWLALTAESADVAGHVSVASDTRCEATYRDWLVACDVGVQLRTYGLGGLSGALLDCIAAGIPTVSNDHLAAAMEAPSYIARVRDNLSATRVAEEIADMIDCGLHRQRPLLERRETLSTRNFDVYCRRLIEALGVA